MNLDDIKVSALQNNWDRYSELTVSEAYSKWVKEWSTIPNPERTYWRNFFRKHIYGLS